MCVGHENFCHHFKQIMPEQAIDLSFAYVAVRRRNTKEALKSLRAVKTSHPGHKVTTHAETRDLHAGLSTRNTLAIMPIMFRL